MLIDFFEETEEDQSKFLSFLVFEPSSIRVPESDILLIGTQVIDYFNDLYENNTFSDNLNDQTLFNRLERLHMMIELLKNPNGLVMTKFLNKIWRRYAFFSNLGEQFITLGNVSKLTPNHTFNESPILDRHTKSSDDPSMDVTASSSDKKKSNNT